MAVHEILQLTTRNQVSVQRRNYKAVQLSPFHPPNTTDNPHTQNEKHKQIATECYRQNMILKVRILLKVQE